MPHPHPPTHLAPDGRRRVVAAAVVRGGRLLAARRVEPPALAGGWELPGGKVEPGEDDAAAVVRELAEELDVAVAVGRRIGGEWPLGDAYVLHVYAATLAPGAEPRALGVHDALAWVGAAEVDALGWLPHDRGPALAAAAALLGG